LLEEGLDNEAVDNAVKCLSDGCLSGDTQVTTKSELKRIDQIQEGEFVLAKDVKGNIIDCRQVKIEFYIKVKERVVVEVLKCTKQDYDQILENLNLFWDKDDSEKLKKLKILHHPMMIYEFGDNAFVIKEGNKVVAYLLGLFSTAEPVAYVHFIACLSDYKRKGLATKLYKHFAEKAKKCGYKYLKAITSVGNTNSINFHKSLGMSLLGEPNEDGIPMIKDYSGPGEDRVVFKKEL